MRRAGVLRGKCLAYWVLLGVVTVRASFARNPVFRGVLFLYGNAASIRVRRRSKGVSSNKIPGLEGPFLHQNTPRAKIAFFLLATRKKCSVSY